jgi:hypothetical protein
MGTTSYRGLDIQTVPFEQTSAIQWHSTPIGMSHNLTGIHHVQRAAWKSMEPAMASIEAAMLSFLIIPTPLSLLMTRPEGAMMPFVGRLNISLQSTY